MAGPLIVVAGAVAGAVASPVAGGVTGPILGWWTQANNYANPSAIPTLDAVISTYLRGKYTPQQFSVMARSNGADVFGETSTPESRAMQKIWGPVISASYAWPDAAQVYRSFTFGHMDRPQYLDWMTRAGANPGDWEQFKAMFQGRLSPVDAMALRNRGLLSPDDFRLAVQQGAGIQGDEFNGIDHLRNQIPGPSDLVRFVVREAFNDAQADKLGLDSEYDENKDFPLWMHAQGFGPVQVRTEAGDFKTLDSPKLYWRAHWDLPSPTQSYEMLHRLRPTGGPNGGPRDQTGPDRGADAEVFTPEDLNALLKASDYSPKFRGKLAAVSYKPLGRIDIRRMYRAEVFGKPAPAQAAQAAWGPAELELVELFQDAGYSRATSLQLTAFTHRNYWETRSKPLTRLSSALIYRGYMLGAITLDRARALLRDHGLTDAEIDAGIGRIEVNAEIDYLDRAVKAVRKAYLAGVMSLVEVDVRLNALKLQDDKRIRLRQMWQLELVGQRRELTAQATLDMVERGLLTPAEAGQRLSNLQYTDDAIRLMLTRSAQNIQAAVTKENLARARSQKQLAREAMQEQTRLRLEADRLRRLAIGKAVLADLKRWYGKGKITKPEVKDRLEKIGYIPGDVERILGELNGQA